MQGLHGKASPRSPSTDRTSRAATPQPSLNFNRATANEGHSLSLGEPTRAIVEYPTNHTGWHAKADVLGVTCITDGQWNTAIAELLANGRVIRHGERRGARYRFVGDPT